MYITGASEEHFEEKDFLWKKLHFYNYFRTFGEKFLAGLSKLHSVCPDEHFKVLRFSKKFPNVNAIGEHRVKKCSRWAERMIFLPIINMAENKNNKAVFLLHALTTLDSNYANVIWITTCAFMLPSKGMSSLSFQWSLQVLIPPGRKELNVRWPIWRDSKKNCWDLIRNLWRRWPWKSWSLS